MSALNNYVSCGYVYCNVTANTASRAFRECVGTEGNGTVVSRCFESDGSSAGSGTWNGQSGNRVRRLAVGGVLE